MKKVQCKDIPDVEMLTAVMKYQLGIDQRFPYQQFGDRYPEKVAYAKMANLAKRGLIEYGVSLRTAWITDAGMNYIDRTV